MRRRSFTLHISGYVEKFVTIHPKVAYIKGPVGQPLSATVTITPEAKYPFTIIGSRARRGENFSYALHKKREGNKYVLDIANRKTEVGRYHDIIYLKTDSNVRREIKVYVYGKIYEQPPKNVGKSCTKE